MVICCVFGCNYSSRKNCCGILGMQTQLLDALIGRIIDVRLDAPDADAPETHFRRAQLGLRTHYAVITPQCLNAFTDVTQDVQIP